MLGRNTNFRLKRIIIAKACTKGAILIASGRVPKTVNTFTVALFFLCYIAYFWESNMPLFSGASGENTPDVSLLLK